MKLKVLKIYADAKLPTRGYEGDAGLDLYTYNQLTLKPGERTDVATGIKMEIPEGCVGLVWDKSGLSFKHGIKTLGGVVDAGYRGEIRIGVVNLGQTDFTFNKGDKVAQMIIQKFENCPVEEVLELTETVRAEKCFGSTGGC